MKRFAVASLAGVVAFAAIAVEARAREVRIDGSACWIGAPTER